MAKPPYSLLPTPYSPALPRLSRTGAPLGFIANCDRLDHTYNHTYLIAPALAGTPTPT